jgi:autophagy-related protein 33
MELQGVSASLSTIALPALLTLPTAVTARSTLTYLSSKTRVYTSYLRYITTFALFSAYMLSPPRFRHPYLLYTSIFTFASGPGIDYAVSLKEGTNERRATLNLEAQGDDVNGEQVRQQVERMKFTEGVRAVVGGFAFAMGVIGIWGDGATSY